MNEICGDNRFEIIAKAKAHLLDATNIDTSEDEMKVLDSFLFRCWQMGWLDRYDTADRKTEPQKPTYNPTSANNLWEKPTNPYVETMSCQECKHYNGNDGCDVMTSSTAECKYEPQTDCAWREP